MTTKSRLILVINLLVLAHLSVAAQSNLQSLAPANEEFSVSMPKDPVIETGKMPYHKFELNTRLYLSLKPNEPVFAVASFSGIKSNPALYTEMARMNSYVDALKKFIAERIGPKDAVAKLTLVRERSLNGNAGREYQIALADRAGLLQVYSTRKRFYAIVFLTTPNKKTDALRDSFLSSFMLPEKIAQPAEAVASQTPSAEVSPEVPPANSDAKPAAEGDSGNSAGQKTEGSDSGEQTPAEKEAAKQPTTDPATNAKKVSGGMMNNKAIVLPQPEYPAEARAARVDGAVTVQITVDEYGNVIAAHAVSGHPLLQQTSVNAAMLARFNPTTLSGQPVQVTGIILYKFVLQ